jgi:hypothetical protein
MCGDTCGRLSFAVGVLQPTIIQIHFELFVRKQCTKYQNKKIYLNEKEMISYVFDHIKCFDEKIMST